MKIGAKYKIARRLGAQVFEKTQGAKFALSLQKREKAFRPRQKSNFGIQLLEKQKVRFTYGISEKHCSRYAREAIEKNPTNASELLFQRLEQRLDSVVAKSGFAPTRRAARQMVSHGHFTVNGVRTNIPSRKIEIGDIVAVREGSKNRIIFQDVAETSKDVTIPEWISVDIKALTTGLKTLPTYKKADQHFDLLQVLQFYKR